MDEGSKRTVYSEERSRRFEEVEYAQNAGDTLWRLMEYFSGERPAMACIFITVLAGTICGVLAPRMQSNGIDIIAGAYSGNLLLTILYMLLFYLLYSASLLLQGRISAKISQKAVKRMREDLFEKILDLPIRYLDTHSRGDVMSRLVNDIENISTTISQSLPTMIAGVFIIIGTLIAMFLYCWQLTLLSVLTIIISMLVTRILSHYVRNFSRTKQRYLGELNGIAQEMITGYRTVSAYSHQKITIDRFCEVADSLTAAGIRTDVTSSVMGPLMNCIGNMSFVVIAVFGGYFAIKEVISVGVISAFIVYAKQFSRPLNEIAQVYGQLQTAIAGAERVFEILDEEEESEEGVALEEKEVESISFEHVCFSYKEGNPIIRDFTLEIPKGKKVALVGATGSGKTTIVNLLLRFYGIDSGTIRINHQNIQKVSLRSLRRSMAIVLQDTVLFSDTVRKNLKYGNEHATEEEMQTAVDMSHCRELIEALPQGYDTVLYNAGKALSQGERQLLAIAYAFVANPQILILDEATSNVDVRTERTLQAAMQRLMHNRTSIVIAHRLSTIRDADMIIVMGDGRIVEQGSHRELLEKKGKYYELYMTQYSGFAT